MSHVLVVNSGSSSLKFQLVDLSDDSWSAKGLLERIGESDSRFVLELPHQSPQVDSLRLADHGAALTAMLDALQRSASGLDDLVAVGHRVVHGGPDYRQPTVIDDEVVGGIEALVPLAPLYNPPALVGIRELRRLLPDVPQVAVFDTAFHAHMPPEAYTYAIPVDLAHRYRLRRYGFHGTSFRYVTRRAAELLELPVDEVNLVICHLGNGASMAAVRRGVGVDTSMGLTPLQGLVMGTRSGDIDPAVVFQLVRVGGMQLDDVDDLLNKASGLKGLAGDQDMREVHRRADAGDAAARLALDVYAYRIRFYLAAYLGVVPNVHAVVFTAGIGEHDAQLRHQVCAPLAHLGIRIDEAANTQPGGGERRIDDRSGAIRVLVVPTNEEAEIARQAAEAVAAVEE